FRLLPTFLTAFFTAAAEWPVFFDSYRSSWFCPPATWALSCLRPRAVFFAVAIGSSFVTRRPSNAAKDSRVPERFELCHFESAVAWSCSVAFQRRKPAAIGVKGPLPSFIEPALASPVEKVPSGARGIHEIKFDGY